MTSTSRKVQDTSVEWEKDETPEPGYKNKVILVCLNTEKHPCPCGCHKSGSECGECNGISVNKHRTILSQAEQRGYLAGGKDLVNYLISHATAENEDTYFIKIKKSDLQSKLEGNGKEEEVK